MDIFQTHKGGKIEVIPKKIITSETLSIVYTPGVAKVCNYIAENPSSAKQYTMNGNTVAVVSDGTAVLGLGDIGPQASLPVMEGKAALFKQLAGVNAVPLVLKTKGVDEIVETIVRVAPTFAGINLEDISAPRCFEIERRLQERLSIPVFHDDQHGTAIVVLAGLHNALQVVGKKMGAIKVVINGAGAAGLAIAYLLRHAGVNSIIVCDSKGPIYDGRENLNNEKQRVASFCERSDSLRSGLNGADVFIGVSTSNVLTKNDVALMDNPIIFACANPTPEIMPGEAYAGGAKVVATGRSDFVNQVNNVLVFPGLFKALIAYPQDITNDLKLKVAMAIASTVVPTKDCILPSALDLKVPQSILEALCVE